MTLMHVMQPPVAHLPCGSLGRRDGGKVRRGRTAVLRSYVVGIHTTGYFKGLINGRYQ